MSGEWPADPTDPRCPECGEPVSATSTFCMHCEADLPADDFGDLRTGSASADDVTAQVEAAAAAESTGTAAGEAADEGALLDPDSLLDDVSTVMVGAVGGLATMVLVGLVVFWLLPRGLGDAAFWLGVAGGAGGGLWIARSRTVFGAANKAGYVVGGLLALVPPALAVSLDWQTPGEAVGGMVVFGIFLWPVALIFVGLGWLLGRGGVDEE